MDGRREAKRWVLHSRGPCPHAWRRDAKPGDRDECLLCGAVRIKPWPAPPGPNHWTHPDCRAFDTPRPLTAADVEEWT